jgi:hypothetical protein
MRRGFGRLPQTEVSSMGTPAVGRSQAFYIFSEGRNSHEVKNFQRYSDAGGAGFPKPS